MLFSFTARVQPRYLEAFTPAVAIALGCGVVALVRRARDLFGVYVLLATFAIAMLEGAAETASGKHGHLAIAIGALLAIPVVAYVAFALRRQRPPRPLAALVPDRGGRARDASRRCSRSRPCATCC